MDNHCLVYAPTTRTHIQTYREAQEVKVVIFLFILLIVLGVTLPYIA